VSARPVVRAESLSYGFLRQISTLKVLKEILLIDALRCVIREVGFHTGCRLLKLALADSELAVKLNMETCSIRNTLIFSSHCINFACIVDRRSNNTNKRTKAKYFLTGQCGAIQSAE
jgi:hypothetical protein